MRQLPNCGFLWATLSLLLVTACAGLGGRPAQLSSWEETDQALRAHFKDLDLRTGPEAKHWDRGEFGLRLNVMGNRRKPIAAHGHCLNFPDDGYAFRFLKELSLLYADGPADQAIMERDYLGGLALFRSRSRLKPLRGFAGEPIGVIGLTSGVEIVSEPSDLPPMLVYASAEQADTFFLVQENRISGIAAQADERFWQRVPGWMDWVDYKVRLSWIADDGELDEELRLSYIPLVGNEESPGTQVIIKKIKTIMARNDERAWKAIADDVAAWEAGYAAATSPTDAFGWLVEQDRVTAKCMNTQGVLPAGALKWLTESYEGWPERVGPFFGEDSKCRTIQDAIVFAKSAVYRKNGRLFQLPEKRTQAVEGLEWALSWSQIRSDDIWVQCSLRLKNTLDTKPTRYLDPAKDAGKFFWKQRMKAGCMDVSKKLLKLADGEAWYSFDATWPSEKRWASLEANHFAAQAKYPQYWEGLIATLDQIGSTERYLKRPLEGADWAEEVSMVMALVPMEKALCSDNRTSKAGKLLFSDVAQRLANLANEDLTEADAAAARKLAQQIINAGSLKPALAHSKR